MLLAGEIALVGDRGDATALYDWFPALGLVATIWLVTGPLWESARLLTQSRTRY